MTTPSVYNGIPTPPFTYSISLAIEDFPGSVRIYCETERSWEDMYSIIKGSFKNTCIISGLEKRKNSKSTNQSEDTYSYQFGLMPKPGFALKYITLFLKTIRSSEECIYPPKRKDLIQYLYLISILKPTAHPMMYELTFGNFEIAMKQKKEIVELKSEEEKLEQRKKEIVENAFATFLVHACVNVRRDTKQKRINKP
ncbi:MAG: hypothetical protein H0W88_11860 [Parachlamydiaceae bacterium]|nr:hypothetical protein [Parachlamydiaceae bacterium]